MGEVSLGAENFWYVYPRVDMDVSNEHRERAWYSNDNFESWGIVGVDDVYSMPQYM